MGKQSSDSTVKRKAVKASSTIVKKSKPKTIAQGNKKDEIFLFVCKQHAIGIKEVTELDIALAMGYKNPRSEGFSKPKSELIKEGLFAKGNEKGIVSLSEKGIEKIPKDMQASNDPKEAHERYITFLEGKAKAGKDKIRPLWAILSDRKSHTVRDIATQLGYSNPRSFDNTKLIATMKQTGLVEMVGKGEIIFTNKVPFLN